MKLINNFKQGIIHGIGILTILAIAGISYAAFNDTISEVSSGNPLKASEYNKIVQKINAIDEEQLATARVSFDGTSCTLGTLGNECNIKDSFNIDKIIRNSTGNYSVIFETAMNNSNYVGVVDGTNLDGIAGTNMAFSSAVIDNTTFNIQGTQKTSTTTRDAKECFIIFFGGK